MDVKTCFAERLKGLRERTELNGEKMSQSDLADAIGVSRGSISFYENADRTADIETLYNVARHFDVSIEYLLGISPDEGTFTFRPDTKESNNGLSPYSKMMAIDFYAELTKCVGEFEDYHAAIIRDGLKGPWVCEHLFTSIRTLILAYSSVIKYLKEGHSLSSIIYKYNETIHGFDHSLDLIWTLSKLLEE